MNSLSFAYLGKSFFFIFEEPLCLIRFFWLTVVFFFLQHFKYSIPLPPSPPFLIIGPSVVLRICPSWSSMRLLNLYVHFIWETFSANNSSSKLSAPLTLFFWDSHNAYMVNLIVFHKLLRLSLLFFIVFLFVSLT